MKFAGFAKSPQIGALWHFWTFTTEYKLPVGLLSCFESLMVNVSYALTWMRFTTCIRGIYHHVSGDTLPHMAINHAFGKNSYAGCGWWWNELNTDLTYWADAMRVDDFKQKQDKNTLWAYSHASSIWWWMSLMILREWDSRRALETFTIKCLTTLCPTGR